MAKQKEIRMKVKNFSFYYDNGETCALKDIDLDIYKNRITAVIGPSGCGKSTFIRVFNRMNELIPGTQFEGKVYLDDYEIHDPEVDEVEIRRKIGMVFQNPNPFPKSIYDNIAYGLRVNGIKDKNFINKRVEESLKDAALWEEVKDRLDANALGLSGGQQQRLCIARCIANNPEVILFDEATSSLDPIASQKIEELIEKLKENFTIVIVTHSMQQAARISDYTAFFYMGELIEFNDTEKMFTVPDKKKTEDYLTGKFG